MGSEPPARRVDGGANAVPIIVHGLRRSGTTIFWETLRSDPAARCYDEPFHPAFAAGARQNHKGTWSEMAEAAAAPDAPPPSGIPPLDELSAETPPAQRIWLAHLLGAGPRVAMDIVRGWNRLPGLYPPGLRCLTIQLVRDPASWAEAHLMPSGQGTWRKPVADLWRRMSRYGRRGFYDNYQYQTIIEAAIARRHPVMAQTALDPQDLGRQPAYVRLLAFWWGANRILRQGCRLAPQPCVVVTHDRFSHAPAATLEEIAALAGWQDARFDCGPVRPSGRPAGARDPHWLRAVRLLGLPPDILDPGPVNGADLAAMFEAGALARSAG
ncbi:MAG TPA: hypothetical protein PKD10_00920 [Paracoccaceae bacterium]|nr:hypothetical protein [Paracoccaceae bacterium]HMO71084.1 hypothetical protein [Paracoccaceae bacterium]